MKKLSKLRKVKGWIAVFGKEYAWADEKPNDLRSFARQENGFIGKKLWQVVPCIITYSLPSKVEKKHNKK